MYGLVYDLGRGRLGLRRLGLGRSSAVLLSVVVSPVGFLSCEQLGGIFRNSHELDYPAKNCKALSYAKITLIRSGHFLVKLARSLL